MLYQHCNLPTESVSLTIFPSGKVMFFNELDSLQTQNGIVFSLARKPSVKLSGSRKM